MQIGITLADYERLQAEAFQKLHDLQSVADPAADTAAARKQVQAQVDLICGETESAAIIDAIVQWADYREMTRRVEELLGVSFPELAEHLEQQGNRLIASFEVQQQQLQEGFQGTAQLIIERVPTTAEAAAEQVCQEWRANHEIFLSAAALCMKADTNRS